MSSRAGIRMRPTLRGVAFERGGGRRRVLPWWCMLLAVAVVGTAASIAVAVKDPLARASIEAARGGDVSVRDASAAVAHAARVKLENLFSAGSPPDESELPTVRVWAAPGALARMCALAGVPPPCVGPLSPDIEPAGRVVLDGGREQDVTILPAGMHGWDRHTSKPSLYVRFEESDGRRHDFEYMRPTDALALKHALPNWIAAKHGLIADGSELVRLFIDDRYAGVYVRERSGDDAIAGSRVHGAFFQGTLALSADIDPAEHELFHRFWKYGDPAPQVEALERLSEVLDMDAWAKCAAIEIASGVCEQRATYLRKLFLSPTRGLIEPVVYEDRAFGGELPADAPPDRIDDPVLKLAMTDPRWVHARNVFLRELLATDFEPAAIVETIDSVLARARPDLSADTNLGEAVLETRDLENPFDDEELASVSVRDLDAKRRELLDWIERRHAFLEEYFADAQVRVAADPDGGSRVEVAGHAAVRVRRVNGSLVHADTWAGAPDVLYPGLASTESRFDVTPSIYAPFVAPAPLAYHVDAAPDELHFENALTREVVVAQTGRFEPAPLLSVHPSRFTLPDTKEIVLGPGELVLDHDLVTARGQALTIKPGTRILLARNVGIYARGPVYALGLPEQGIELGPRDSEPWACLGIAGADSAGSRIEYLTATRGSRGTDGRIRFNGMLSIYDCPDVVVRECRFARNAEGGAAVDVAQSRAAIERCQFESTCAGALELDLARGEVRECRFVRSGGDSIRARACELAVRGCQFAASGRAGLAIGEASRVRASECVFDGCEIGVDAVHGSRALLERDRFGDCPTAVRAGGWRSPDVDGARLALVECTIAGARAADVELGDGARVQLMDTDAPHTTGAGSLERAAKIDDSWLGDVNALDGGAAAEKKP